jgi:uncharacterized SAM-binding protein YcdF (DUF218 family)
MFFILSKILLVLILPLTWVFGLIAFSLFAKKPKTKQYLLTGALVTLCFFGNRFTGNLIGNLWDVAPSRAPAPKYSAVIVLGGFVSEGKNGQGYFNAAIDRFNTATDLLATGKAQHLLFTGGNADINPNGFSEAPFIKQQLKKLNFADSLILLDGKARNTFENAANAKAILIQANLKPPYLLVTSAYHMRRAQLIFKKAGLDVVPYPCDYLTTKGTVLPSDIIPGTDALGKCNLYIKEMVGYIVAYLN